MFKIKPSHACFFLHSLLFFIIAASALTYWSVAEYALKGHWHPDYYTFQDYISIVPTWQKVLKDGFACLLLAFSLILRPTNSAKNILRDKILTISYILCIFVLSIAFARSVNSDFSLAIILSCLRPIAFVISLFVFCERHLNYYYLCYVLEGVNLLAIIQVFYAFSQRQSAVMQNGIAWFSSGYARSVGTFIGPNTLGLFLAITFFINLYILPWHNFRSLILVLCFYAVFLSDSRTSLLITILLFIEYVVMTFISKLKFSIKDFYFIQIMVAGLIFVNITFLLDQVKNISVRGAQSTSSGGRLEILLGYINSQDIFSILFGKSLAYGSNLVLTLQTDSDSLGGNSFIADSTWTSLLSQFGIMGVVLAIGIICLLLRSPQSNYLSYQSFTAIKKQSDFKKIGLLIYFLPASFTIILFESYATLPILITVVFLIKMQTFYSLAFCEKTMKEGIADVMQ